MNKKIHMGVMVLTCLIIMFVMNIPQVFSERPSDNLIQILIGMLTSSNWPDVHKAKWHLESLQSESVEELINQLNTNKVVKLTNTMDLIYPGAETFYGEGFIVDYDLDYIPARVGWVLEELSFEDFGFKAEQVNEERLMNAMINGKKDVAMDKVISNNVSTSQRSLHFQEAIIRAKDWWLNHKETWTRYQGLIEALKSGNENRQMNALDWLRYGTTECDGLSLESYSKDILPIVKELAESKKSNVQNQARLLIGDKENWWWKLKSDQQLRERWEPDSKL